MELITGYAGEPHVYPADDAALNKSILTTENVVLEVDEQFAYEQVYNNKIRVKSGAAVFQGRLIRIRTNQYDEVIIENGTQALIRHDLIVARYNYADGIESAETVVVKGTPGESGTDPDINDAGDIDQGDTICDMPLYRVVINGLNIESVTPLFETIKPMSWLEENLRTVIASNSNLAQSLDDVGGDVSGLQQSLADVWKVIYPVGSIYMSTNNANPSTIWGGTWVAWGSGRVPVGVNASDSNFSTVEKAGGAASVNLAHIHTVASHYHSTGGHTLTVNEIPAHGHSFSGSTDTQGNHMHMYRDYWSCASQEGAAQCVAANSDTDASPGAHTKESGSHVHNFSGTTGNSGGGRAHNHGNTGVASPGTDSKLGSTSILQPYITCYMWKRTA